MIEIGIVLEHAGTTQILRLEIDANASAEALYSLVGARLHLDPHSFVLANAESGRVLSDRGDINSLRILNGDRITVDTSRTPTDRAVAEVTIEVNVLEGPHAGEWFALGASTFEIGRRVPDGDVKLDRDETVSRHHAKVEVTVDGVFITDLGSSNGTLIDDTEITTTSPVTPGQLVMIGDSALAITRRADIRDLAHLRYEDGHLLFNRPARMQHRQPTANITLPKPPDAPTSRRLPKAAMVGPALLGVPMFFVTRNPLSLIMIAGTPLLALFSWVDDRTSGRAQFRKNAAAFREDLTGAEQAVTEAQTQSLQWRIDRNPGVDEVLRRAAERSPELWQRDANNSDLLEVRVGTIDQPSLVSITAPSDGAEDLVKAAQQVAATHQIDRDAPIVIPIGRTPQPDPRPGRDDPTSRVSTIGIVGAGPETRELARWCLTQLVVHHSPQDVAIAILAPGEDLQWQWTRWLPHLEQLSSEDSTDDAMLALDETSATKLFAALRSYANNRAEAAREAYTGGIQYKPHVVVIVALPLRVHDADFAAFLTQLGDANMSAVLLAPDRRMIPRHADVVINVADEEDRIDVDFVRIGVDLTGGILDHLSIDDAERVARSLAPLRDVSTPESGSTGIPSRVNLLEMLDLVPLTPDKVATRWAQPPKGVQAPLGVDATGILTIDLNPHGLIGGTTGAGKSELLQTYVASLALTYPPERLNFVFVDFKGGLAFNQCIELPHAVGLITNLDPHLAERVMKSLQAELDERTRTINALGGGDLATLAQKYPTKTPPELVIVFDEFREAVERVPSKPGEPSFIDRVMSLARLGRQVGMHVILATQTPEGVVTEDLKNNIDLRIALRVKTTDASRSIIERPDAALITKRTPGRAFAQLEAHDIREFQAAFVGGHAAQPDDAIPEPSLHTLRPGRGGLGNLAELKRAAAQEGKTDLQIIVDTTIEANHKRGTDTQRRPWLEELPSVLALRDVLDGWTAPESRRRFVLPVARSDDPAHQCQDWYAADLEQAGSMLVFGGAASGKTTLLRTLAAVAAERFAPDEVHIYALDFTGQGLGGLIALPHCAASVAARETDRVRQLVALLQKLVSDRIEALGQAGAGSIAELNQRDGPVYPILLWLFDGFFQFYEQYADQASDRLYDDVLELIENGRAAGLHTVVTAARANVPPNVANAIPLKLVMRMNSADEYSSLGLRDLAGSGWLTPGRAFTSQGLELQIGVPTPDTWKPGAANIDVGDQNAALTEISASLEKRWATVSAPRMRALPKDVPITDLGQPPLRTRRFAIAVDEVSVAPVELDLERTPTFVVVGPDESGKSTTLAAIADRFALAWPVGHRYLLTGRRSPLAQRDGFWTQIGIGPDAAATLLQDLKPEIVDRASRGFEEPILVLVDDADTFGDGAMRNVLDETQPLWRDAGLIVAVAVGTFAASKMYAPWFKSMVSARSGLLLTPDLASDGAIFDRRLPQRARLELPPGRGFLLDRSGYTLVQIARPAST